MKKEQKQFIIPPIGDQIETVSSYMHAAAWPDEEICFNITNFGYPTLHTHEYYELLCVLTGSIFHRINGKRYLMRAGDCCLIRPADCHCLEIAEPADNPFLNVNFMVKPTFFARVTQVFDPSLLDDILHIRAPLDFSVSTVTLSEIEKTCLYIQKPVSQPARADVMVCMAMVAKLISECLQSHFSEAHNAYPAWLQSFLLALHDPTNFQKNLSELTEGIPYSYSYIQRQFREYLGTPIVAYRNSVKMASAKNLVTSTQMSVSEIAFYLGFDSVAHLNHLFRKAYGYSPLELRRASHR